MTDRTALGCAPDDLADTVAHSIVVRVKALADRPRRGHLRLVQERLGHLRV